MLLPIMQAEWLRFSAIHFCLRNFDVHAFPREVGIRAALIGIQIHTSFTDVIKGSTLSTDDNMQSVNFRQRSAFRILLMLMLTADVVVDR